MARQNRIKQPQHLALSLRVGEPSARARTLAALAPPASLQKMIALEHNYFGKKPERV